VLFRSESKTERTRKWGCCLEGGREINNKINGKNRVREERRTRDAVSYCEG
jgi:hypothetical protein